MLYDIDNRRNQYFIYTAMYGTDRSEPFKWIYEDFLDLHSFLYTCDRVRFYLNVNKLLTI